jgi:hypothetical protein
MLNYARLIAQDLCPVVRYAVGYRRFVRQCVSGGAARKNNGGRFSGIWPPSVLAEAGA